MDFNDVYLVNRRLEKIEPSEIQLMRRLIDPSPIGYESFWSTFGRGVFCNFISLWRPKSIEKELTSVREAVQISIEWFNESHTVPVANFAECVPIGMSVDGDYLVVCPDRPADVFAIPRHDFDSVYQLPQGLGNMLYWERCIDRSTDYVYHPPFPYFESFLGRSSVSLLTGEILNLSSVVDHLYQTWSHDEIREIRSDETLFLFPRAIDGRVQITRHGGPLFLSFQGSGQQVRSYQPGGKTRIGIDISFDFEFLNEVNSMIADLEEWGFSVLSRTVAKE
jgi:hypothetical protein